MEIGEVWEMMMASEYFSADYFEARDKFLAEARAAGASIEKSFQLADASSVQDAD